MEKLDKVIAGLEQCHRDVKYRDCDRCGYASAGSECERCLMEDALELLRSRSGSGDLISRSKVLAYPLRRATCDREHANPHFINGVESVMEYVENLPTVDAVEVVHAYWVGDDPGDWHCSHCGEYAADGGFEQTKYCPNCGAKMEE